VVLKAEGKRKIDTSKTCMYCIDTIKGWKGIGHTKSECFNKKSEAGKKVKKVEADDDDDEYCAMCKHSKSDNKKRVVPIRFLNSQSHDFQVSHLGIWRPFSLRNSMVASRILFPSSKPRIPSFSHQRQHQCPRALDNIAETANITNMTKVAGTRDLETAATATTTPQPWTRDEVERIITWMEDHEEEIRGKQVQWHKEVKDQVFVDEEHIPVKRITEKMDNMRKGCEGNVTTFKVGS